MICRALIVSLASAVLLVGCSNDSQVQTQQAVSLAEVEFSWPSREDLVEQNGRLYLDGVDFPLSGPVRSAGDSNALTMLSNGLPMRIYCGVRDVGWDAFQEPGRPPWSGNDCNWDKALIDRWETD